MSFLIHGIDHINTILHTIKIINFNFGETLFMYIFKKKHFVLCSTLFILSGCAAPNMGINKPYQKANLQNAVTVIIAWDDGYTVRSSKVSSSGIPSVITDGMRQSAQLHLNEQLPDILKNYSAGISSALNKAGYSAHVVFSKKMLNLAKPEDYTTDEAYSTGSILVINFNPEVSCSHPSDSLLSLPKLFSKDITKRYPCGIRISGVHSIAQFTANTTTQPDIVWRDVTSCSTRLFSNVNPYYECGENEIHEILKKLKKI